MSTAVPAVVAYEITPDLAHHYFHVTMRIPAATTNTLLLRLPAWLPGSYMIRDFAKHVVAFSATGTEGALDSERPDKNSWLVHSDGGEVVIRYTVYAFDLSVRTSYLAEEFGFFNPSALCLEAVNHNQSQHQITLNNLPSQWQVRTGMNASHANHTYSAESYEVLIDFPFLLGELTVVEFSAKGISHALVLTQPHFADTDALSRDLKRICEAQLELFSDDGTPPPFDNYQFLTMVVGDGFGGLEHRNSTALLCSRHTLEPGSEQQPEDDYLTFLSLCSHEYFHSWNIKSLRPQEFHPYQLQQEQYTEQLWFYEGMTSYYDDWMVYRSGAMTQQSFLNRLSQSLTRALRGKGPQRQSIAESSQLAWTTFYQQNENAANAIASYYSKGAVVALMADLYVRSKHPEKSLDDIMRLAYRNHRHQGTTLNDLFSVFAEVGGKPLEEIVKRAVLTTEAIDLSPLFAEVGIEWLPTSVDPFSQQPTLTSSREASVSFGAALQETAQGVMVQRVWEDSPAAKAGLAKGDRLVAIDHIEASRANIMRAFQRYQPGTTATLHYFRRDTLVTRPLQWQAPVADGYRLAIRDQEKARVWLS
ncbi:M61 family metallopeptidase [Aliidiomarina indica]|uniref:M61 family metallopeptidase n=1 Tax=Aliidiomarina indica TaxID=2749147 RepID=UPI00188EABF8|nr:PDZ domain-containing protein [Aliidiomarina indica]